MSETEITIIGLVAVVALVAMNAFFVATEFSFVAVRRTRRREGEAVRADRRRRERNRRHLLRFRGRSARPVEIAQRGIEPEKEWRAQRETREHVLA